jgi:hypothetical protein
LFVHVAVQIPPRTVVSHVSDPHIASFWHAPPAGTTSGRASAVASAPLIRASIGAPLSDRCPASIEAPVPLS